MIAFPNCKINLGLHVKEQRPDGFHDIETVFYPVAWRDVLEIVRSPKDELKLFVSGIPVDTEDNICIKAFLLLQKQFGLPAVEIHLHKAIPTGAGLGGGSSDGAFTLKLLNEKFGLGLTEDQLLTIALRLGSDCPFFIRNQPSLAKGRGEEMENIQVDLGDYHIVLVYPGIHVSTAEAFSGIEIHSDHPALQDIILSPVTGWKDQLVNDFEKTIFKKHPAIRVLKDQLYDRGAVYASLSGSGSAMYGIFPRKPDIGSLPADHIVQYLPGKF